MSETKEIPARVAMTIRLPPTAYARLKAAAKLAGVSINTYVVRALAKGVVHGPGNH